MYAGNYEPMLHCRWTLIAPAEQVVRIEFSRFNLEPQPVNDTRNCPHDYIEVQLLPNHF